MAQFNTLNEDHLARMRKTIVPKLERETEHSLHWMDMSVGGEVKRNAGGLTLEYYKVRKANKDNVQAVGEDPSAINSRGGSPITKLGEVTLEENGDVFEFSNKAEATDIFKILKEEIPMMGQDAALWADANVRDTVVAGMLNSNNMLSRFAGIEDTTAKTSALNFADVLAGDNATHKFTPLTAAGCKTALILARAKKYEGNNFACLIPANLSHDFTQDDRWVKPHEYNGIENIWNGEIGILNGIRYVEVDASFIEGDSYGTFDLSGKIHSTFVFGRGSVGTPKFSGTADPTKPEVVILNKADKSDPLNLIGKAGYKMLWNAILLRPDWMCHCRARSTFS